MNNIHKLPKTLWAGFVDGKIDLDTYQGQDGTFYGVLYTSKREAKRHYQDVRRVEIREVKP